MARLTAILVVALIASTPPALAQTRRSVSRPGVAISGTVKDAVTGSPLQAVTINIKTPLKPGVASTTTDKAGQYRLDGLQPGEYSLHTVFPGYVTIEESVDLAAEPVSIDFRLDRAATLRGRVLAEDGTPLRHVFVQATPPGGAPDRRSRVIGAETDAFGRYQLDIVPPGRFEIVAKWMGDGRPLLRELVAYYAGTAPGVDRAEIEVRAGMTYSELNIVVPRSSAFVVEGQVVAADVSASDVFLVTDTATYDLSVRPTGTFITPRLPSGRYTLVAHGVVNGHDEAAAVTVQLDRDVNDLVLQLMPTATLSGRVVTDDGSELPAYMQIGAVLTEQNARVPPHPRDRTDVGPGGSFEIAGLFGQRIMRTGAADGWTVSRVMVNGTTAANHQLALSQDVRNVLVVLTRR